MYNRNQDLNRQFFKFEERYNERTRIKWVILKDQSDVIWGLYSNYRRAKDAISILMMKYGNTIKQRAEGKE